MSTLSSVSIFSSPHDLLECAPLFYSLFSEQSPINERLYSNCDLDVIQLLFFNPYSSTDLSSEINILSVALNLNSFEFYTFPRPVKAPLGFCVLLLLMSWFNKSKTPKSQNIMPKSKPF